MLMHMHVHINPINMPKLLLMLMLMMRCWLGACAVRVGCGLAGRWGSVGWKLQVVCGCVCAFVVALKRGGTAGTALRDRKQERAERVVL